MKKTLFCFILLASLFGLNKVSAQAVVGADDEHNYSDFYQKTLDVGKRAMPYAFLRESDIVWRTTVWRTIDFREKFNQFFFYPIETESNTQGRVNLVNTLLTALKNGEIEVFEDDDLRIPKDYEKVWSQVNRSRNLSMDVYDEWGEVIGSKDTVINEEFKPEDVLSAQLKECWYIDKQDTRQKVRIIALSLIRLDCRERAEGRVCDPIPMFWVPIDDMRVRNVLVKARAYDERSDVAERSYDDVLIDRYFDSFVTRQSNVKNRSISSYLTGTDAILESQRIEDEIFNIESDMWEY